MSSHLRVHCESYLMNTTMTGFRYFTKIFTSLCFRRKYPQHWMGCHFFRYRIMETKRWKWHNNGQNIIITAEQSLAIGQGYALHCFASGLGCLLTQWRAPRPVSLLWVWPAAPAGSSSSSSSRERTDGESGRATVFARACWLTAARRACSEGPAMAEIPARGRPTWSAGPSPHWPDN